MGDNKLQINLTNQIVGQIKSEARSHPNRFLGSLCVATRKIEQGEALSITSVKSSDGCFAHGSAGKRLGYVSAGTVQNALKFGILGRVPSTTNFLPVRGEPDDWEAFQTLVPALSPKSSPKAASEANRTRDIVYGKLLNEAQSVAMNHPNRMPGDVCVGKVELAGKGERLTFSNQEKNHHCKAEDYYIPRIGYMPARMAAELQRKLNQADFEANPSVENKVKLETSEQRLNRIEWTDGEEAVKKFESFDVFVPRFRSNDFRQTKSIRDFRIHREGSQTISEHPQNK